MQRLGVILAHLTRRISLPRYGGRVGLHIDLFEACSAFTRVAACTLAQSPIVTANRRLQPFRYLHDCSDCFRLERFAGWASHPLESAAFSRRTPSSAIFSPTPSAAFGHSKPPKPSALTSGERLCARCDLDLTIDKRGRPYSLVCTKNQASYDRRANQRKQDLEDLARLDH